ncbi:MAG: hypothetical protein R3F14_13300 [Polyangiaceae bacterium]
MHVTTCLRPGLASAAPRSARLFDSVPPDVNTISPALAPISAATCSRASSTALRAACPYACWLDGFPNRPRR